MPERPQNTRYESNAYGVNLKKNVVSILTTPPPPQKKKKITKVNHIGFDKINKN